MRIDQMPIKRIHSRRDISEFAIIEDASVYGENAKHLPPL